jgi:hypothetical protein
MNEEPDRPTDDSTDAEEPIRGRYDWSATAPSTAVVETVGDAVGCDPMRLPPLYDVVDPDALDTLVRSTDTRGTDQHTSVSFRFADRQVTVRSTGELVVRAAQALR